MTFDDLCSPAAESGIIATLLHNPQFIFHSEQLHPRDFADPINACLYWGISELAHDGVTSIDDYQLSTILSSNKAVETHVKKIELRDIQSIFELSDYACRHTVEEYQALVKDVQDFKSKRELHQNAQKLAQACLTNVSSDALQSMLYNMAENHTLLSSRSKPIQTFGEKIDSLWSEQINRQTGKIATIPFHIKEMNDFSTLEAGELIIIGAASKVGKSAFLLSSTVDLLRRDLNVLIVDSELADRLYMLRLISHITQIPFKIVKDGPATPEQLQRIQEAREWIKSKSLYHEYIPMFSETELLSTFRRVNCIKKVDVLIVDYFKITEGSDAFDVSLRLSGLVNMCKNEIAGAYGIPVLSAIQTSENGTVALSKGVIRYCSTLFTLRRKTPAEFSADGGADFGNTYMMCPINRNGRQMNDQNEHIAIQFEGDTLTYKSANKQPTVIEPY